VLRNASNDELPLGPVVISYDLWQRRFGGASDAVGQPLRISGRPYEVIGVLPSDFRVLAPRLMNLDVHRDLASYEAAKARHPERWSGPSRNWEPEKTVYLNPGKPMKKEGDLKQKAA